MRAPPVETPTGGRRFRRLSRAWIVGPDRFGSVRGGSRAGVDRGAPSGSAASLWTQARAFPLEDRSGAGCLLDASVARPGTADTADRCAARAPCLEGPCPRRLQFTSPLVPGQHRRRRRGGPHLPHPRATSLRADPDGRIVLVLGACAIFPLVTSVFIAIDRYRWPFEDLLCVLIQSPRRPGKLPRLPAIACERETPDVEPGLPGLAAILRRVGGFADSTIDAVPDSSNRGRSAGGARVGSGEIIDFPPPVFDGQQLSAVPSPALVPDLARGIVDAEALADFAIRAFVELPQNATAENDIDAIASDDLVRIFDVKRVQVLPAKKSNCRYSDVEQGAGFAAGPAFDAAAASRTTKVKRNPARIIWKGTSPRLFSIWTIRLWTNGETSRRSAGKASGPSRNLDADGRCAAERTPARSFALHVAVGVDASAKFAIGFRTVTSTSVNSAIGLSFFRRKTIPSVMCRIASPELHHSSRGAAHP